mmetsp:Transcript_21148/g.60371  ORF Transcript_21148/g.60371 Transcript_21148/m.60371 type:complete len:204 (-) Transcript_21148:1011-1622(-)
MSDSNGPRRSRRRGTTTGAAAQSAGPAFPLLDEGTRNGLGRFVHDNATLVKQMMDITTKGKDDVAVVCEKCALVIRQQQLTPSSFLARFFDVSVLAEHAALLGKSSKGNAPVLADRIANEWRKNRHSLRLPADEHDKQDDDDDEDDERKKKDSDVAVKATDDADTTTTTKKRQADIDGTTKNGSKSDDHDEKAESPKKRKASK